MVAVSRCSELSGLSTRLQLGDNPCIEVTPKAKSHRALKDRAVGFDQRGDDATQDLRLEHGRTAAT